MSQIHNSQLRALPSISRLLNTPEIRGVLERVHQEAVVRTLQEVLSRARDRIRKGAMAPAMPELAVEAIAIILEAGQPRMRRVVNATGVILNTNLGRSVLAASAVAQVAEIATAYSNLEYDLQEGQRGSRYEHVDELLVRLTGAEASLVVNNNAAAVLLVVDTFARDREVVVSRGQLVEIGGSFRIPEVLTASGARLVEVGTTNKTHAADYERAISDQTAMLLRCHTSNYRILGFTSEVSPRDMVSIAHARGVLAVEDLGSGVLVDLGAYGLPAEPTVQATVAAGMDLVTFSGDKLLGGPQAGIIVGTQECISRLKKNPLLRALRLDKLTLAALEATLRLYRDPSSVHREVPILEMLSRPLSVLEQEAVDLAARISSISGLVVSVRPGTSQVGGGSLPATDLPTVLVAVGAEGVSAQALCDRLRAGSVPVIARIERELLLIDPRTLLPGDVERIMTALAEALR